MSFSTRLYLSFSVLIAAVIIVGIAGGLAVRTAIENRNQFVDHDARLLVETEAFIGTSHRLASVARGHLLAPNDQWRATFGAVSSQIDGQIANIREMLDGKAVDQMAVVERQSREYRQRLEELIEARTKAGSADEVAARFVSEAMPMREALNDSVLGLRKTIQAVVDASRREADSRVYAVTGIGMLVGGTALVLAIVLATWLVRSLGRQIGTAVEHVKSSSTELEVTATQQANGAREQATITVQVTTASRELLATSRQIAESAQRVSDIASQAAASAAEGDSGVQQTRDALLAIKGQVDRIVEHMLALGRKTQRIGSVIDIINELTEQTTILSINATIESVAAGEAGTRFGAVADEIRKLADRVRTSTQEIHLLIEDIRSSTNATIMSTEEGSKSVDDGARRFQGLAGIFGRISEMVRATTEASREIELSTKQQTSAVEQVNVAISEVANAAKQSESATRQTQATAAQLANLSRELSSLVRR